MGAGVRVKLQIENLPTPNCQSLCKVANGSQDTRKENPKEVRRDLRRLEQVFPFRRGRASSKRVNLESGTEIKKKEKGRNHGD